MKDEEKGDYRVFLDDLVAWSYRDKYFFYGIYAKEASCRYGAFLYYTKDANFKIPWCGILKL